MAGGGDEEPDHGTLTVARKRFAESLPRKAADLRAGLALLAATPDGARPQKEMRRRVHALLASAQVFRLERLEDALREAVQLLDSARSQGRALTQDELDQLAHLTSTLPALGNLRASEAAPPAPFPPAPTLRLPVPGAAIPPVGPKGTLRLGSLSAGGSPGAPAQPRAGHGTFTAAIRTSRPPAGPGRPVGPGSVRPAATVFSVLVVDGVETQSAVRAMLPVEGYEITGAADPEEALRLARSTAPDVVLADRAIVHRPGVDLVGRLRGDPLTDFVPIVLLLPPGSPHDPVAVREIGADEALERPLDPEQLRRTVQRVVSVGQGVPSAPDALPDLTLAELAERIAAEVRRGLVGAADKGAELTVPLGGGAEVLAATWAAVARIRSVVGRRTGGRVHFRDPPGRGPALLALVAGGEAPVDDAAEVVLEGRRALVVDDDPSIVWFFGGLLRSAGMEVAECFDGNDALVIARRQRPDLVITDILMPGLDGFALLRELRRDVLLSDVPVVVLSWKEDFLQRMRELDAPADAYLRKEVGSAEALLRIKEVLRPRARVEAALRGGNDVRGRLERLGFPALVEIVARCWSDARVVVRDAAHLFELDLRAGVPADVTRTAIDGTFARGESAFLNLVGLRSGRFTVQRADAPVRATLQGTLEEQLRAAAARIGAAIDAVSGAALVKASRVRLDDSAADAIERTSPEPMRSLIARMRDGESPRELVTGGEVDAHVLETCLVDLARRGIVLGVRGLEGEDRLAELAEARAAAMDPAAARPPRPTRSEPPQPIRLSDPELRAVVLSDQPHRSTTPPPTPADARAHAAPALRSSTPSATPQPGEPPAAPAAPARITDPPVLRLSDPDLGRADETPRTMGQRRTLELVGEDAALSAAVAALVSPAPAEALPARPGAAATPPRAEPPARERESGPPPLPRRSEPVVSPPPGPGPEPEPATATATTTASEVIADELDDEPSRPAVIPVPRLSLETAMSTATKSDPPGQPVLDPPASSRSTPAFGVSLDELDEPLTPPSRSPTSSPPQPRTATRWSSPAIERPAPPRSTPPEASEPEARAGRPSSRPPVVDGTLPSVIVSNELEPIVTNVSARKAARMGLVPEPPGSTGSGGLFVLVLILLGLALIAALGWSMTQRRGPEPAEPPGRVGAAEPVGAPASGGQRDDPSGLDLAPPPPSARGPGAMRAASDQAIPVGLLPPPADALRPVAESPGRLRIELPSAEARRPLPFEILVDGRRVHRTDVPSARERQVERELAPGMHEIRIRHAGTWSFRMVHVRSGATTDLDLAR